MERTRRTLISSVAAVALTLLLAAGCGRGGQQSTTPGPGSSTPLSSVPTTSASVPTTTSSTPPATIPAGVARPTPAIPSVTVPAALIGNRANLANTQYVVFAWNDLGMHCANPDYQTAVLLPPYNTLWAQVVKRGNPPQVVTSGLTVEYKFTNNTYSYGKSGFTQFWDNAKALFGVSLEKNKGLNLSDPTISNGLSGPMTAKTNHFEAVGVPLTPINDDGSWNPFQVAEITVKDSAGNVVASTKTTAPVSDELNCARCHGPDTFMDILQKHDKLNGTDLVDSRPVLCASCHGDPTLGKPDPGPGGYLSQRIHGFHATVSPTARMLRLPPRHPDAM